jgi:hypothetical protein
VIYALLTLWTFAAIFIGFTIWWLREFPVPPLVDVMSHPSGIVRRPIERTDLTNYHQVFPAYATSAVGSLTSSWTRP